MGNYYSVHIEDIFPDMKEEKGYEKGYEKEDEKENNFISVQPSFDPNEIFHPSAFDNSNDIKDELYYKVIKFSKKNKYLRCKECNLLTNLAIFTKHKRFTHPKRESLIMIHENGRDKIFIDCKFCNSYIEINI